MVSVALEHRFQNLLRERGSPILLRLAAQNRTAPAGFETSSRLLSVASLPTPDQSLRPQPVEYFGGLLVACHFLG
jgi:hypothetical protein